MKKTVSLVLVLSMIAAVVIGFGTAENAQTLSNTEKALALISTWVQIKWPLNELKDIIESSLRSAMSYTNSTNLQTFKDSEFKQMSPREFELYYK